MPQLNRFMRKLLWYIVIAGILAALPLIYERIVTERSAKSVEIVMDYRDVLDIAVYKPNPRTFIDDQLQRMKEVGITTFAVFESTLDELKRLRRIELYTSQDVAVMTRKPVPADENYTYLLYENEETQRIIQPNIEKTFSRLNVNVRPWSYNGRPGLVIEMPVEDAILKSMDPDPLTLQTLKDYGFRIAVRLSDRRLPFSAAEMDGTLSELSRFGVKTIIVDGDQVPGFANDTEKSSLSAMAQLMNKYNIGLAAIEMLKKPQKGFNKLAYLTGYNVVRLHSLTDKNAMELDAGQIADRFVLAVKDRNIRMIYLNTGVSRDIEKGTMANTLDKLYTSLEGPDGAIERIKKAGYTIGAAEPFQQVQSGWQRPLKAVVLLGAVALIALTAGAFVPGWLTAVFAIGVIGSAALFILSPTLTAQAAALGAGVSAPTLSVIQAIRSIRARAGAPARGAGKIALALATFGKSLAVTLLGVMFVIGLLNQVTYLLVLEQFRGVTLLHLLPIVLVGIYVLFFRDGVSVREIVSTAKRYALIQINILYIVLAGIAGAAVLYYLSRTGNEGQATAYERAFRALLENTLGARPRTKEFLFAHPLFLLAVYAFVKYRSAVYLFIVGVIGQLSVVDTFAHIHTPVYISALRTVYGAIFGIVVGLLYIAAWELIARSWNKWAPSLKE